MNDRDDLIPVIITRADTGALETFDRLQTLRCRPVLSPMLRIIPNRKVHKPALDGVQGLIFTSANGVRAFLDAGHTPQKIAWCVGPSTWRAAEEAGFSECRNANGNADDLYDLICKDANPEHGELVHVANEAAAGDLSNRLQRAGYHVSFAPLYRAQYQAHISLSAFRCLQSAPRGIILIHSAKGANAMERALTGISPSGIWSIVAVSERAGKPLALGKGWPLSFAKRPNEEDLMVLLQEHLAAI